MSERWGRAPTSSPGRIDVAARVDHLDWLRVLALLGVFVFHTLRPFDTDYWHIKAAQQSEVVSAVLVSLASWGLAFFFLVSGAATYLALRWRTSGQYVRERLLRLAVPLAVGWALLGPPQLWLEVHHHEVSDASLPEVALEFLRDPFSDPPLLLGHTYALWFVVYLLEFSLLGLPLFAWLRGPGGARLMAGLGGLGELRGGVLLLFVPIVALAVPMSGDIFEVEHGWGQWAYFFAFFVLGHVVMSDPRLVEGVRRDVLPSLALAVGGIVAVFALDAPGFFDSWDGDVRDGRAVLLLALIAAQAWGWVLVLWGLGMRLPAFGRPLPREVGDSAMPFFVVHQPVILAVAFVVVGWSALAIPVQWALIAVPSFVLAAAAAWALSRTPGVRRLFGVKPRAARG